METLDGDTENTVGRPVVGLMAVPARNYVIPKNTFNTLEKIDFYRVTIQSRLFSVYANCLPLSHC